MLPRYPTIMTKEAKELGYVPVTSEYNKCERDLLAKAVEQIRGTDYALVSDDGGANIAIYRNKAEVRE